MPPPPPPPPLLTVRTDLKKDLPQQNLNGTTDRDALLSQIRHGARLKKASTNDRSSPVVEVKKSLNTERTVHSIGKVGVLASNFPNDGPPSLGDLFAQGIPKLRPTNKSFLEGGNYKSQLSARSGIRTGPSNFSKGSNVQEFISTKSSYSQPPSPKNQNKKISGTNKAVTKSHDNLSMQKVNGPKKSPVLLQKNIISASDATSYEYPSASILKKTFPPVSSSKPNLIHSSYLHQANDSKWGGSVPNLTGENLVKPRTSSKPLIPPKSTHASGNSSTILSQWSSERSKSFEEPTEKTTSVSYAIDKPVAEKNVFETNPYKSNISSLFSSSQESRSEPSSLNKVQNDSNIIPLAPSRLKAGISKSIVKPAGAPPPLPSRPPLQNSPALGSTKHGTLPLHSSPMIHPSATPPPPPPRMLHQQNTEHRPLPPVPTQSVAKSLPNNLNLQSQLIRNDVLHKSSTSTGVSHFESMFLHKFHKISELPKPSEFEIANKEYPSESAKVAKPSRTHQPPPVAPPPPPPPQY